MIIGAFCDPDQPSATSMLPSDPNLVHTFRERRPRYEELAEKLSEELRALLRHQEVDFAVVEHRVKSESSFLEKIERKSYKEPLSEIVDICGLRVICYYASDLERVCDAVSREFVVHERQDKASQMDPDRFGYASIHYIISPPQSWSSPALRHLRDLRAELQIRTILMHAWAAVEHKLAYKKRAHIPSKLRRKLYQLSALFEIADQQFDVIRAERERYIDEQRSELHRAVQRTEGFPDVDALQQFLNEMLPEHARRANETVMLFDELARHSIGITDLRSAFTKIQSDLSTLEDEIDEPQRRLNSKYSRWGQAGVVRAVLDITHDKYWKSRKNSLPDWRRTNTERWRERINSARGGTKDPV